MDTNHLTDYVFCKYFHLHGGIGRVWALNTLFCNFLSMYLSLPLLYKLFEGGAVFSHLGILCSEHRASHESDTLKKWLAGWINEWMSSDLKGKADIFQGGVQCQAQGSGQHQGAGLWPLETNVCVTQPGVSITQRGGASVLSIVWRGPRLQSLTKARAERRGYGKTVSPDISQIRYVSPWKGKQKCCISDPFSTVSGTTSPDLSSYLSDTWHHPLLWLVDTSSRAKSCHWQNSDDTFEFLEPLLAISYWVLFCPSSPSFPETLGWSSSFEKAFNINMKFLLFWTLLNLTGEFKTCQWEIQEESRKIDKDRRYCARLQV